MSARNVRLITMFVIASSLGLYLAYRERDKRVTAVADAAASTTPVAPEPAAPPTPAPAEPNPGPRFSQSEMKPILPRGSRPAPERVVRPTTPDRDARTPVELTPTPAVGTITKPRDN